MCLPLSGRHTPAPFFISDDFLLRDESPSIASVVAFVAVEQGRHFLTAMRARLLARRAGTGMGLVLMRPAGNATTTIIAARTRCREPVAIHLVPFGITK